MNEVFEPKDINKDVFKDPRGDVKVVSRPPLKLVKKRERSIQDNELSRPNKSGFSFKSLFKIFQIIGCWLPTILIIIFFIFIFVRPQGVWGNFTNLINNGLTLPKYEEKTIEEVREEINKQLTNVGENNVQITSSQLNILIKDRFTQFTNLKAEIVSGEINFIWQIEAQEQKKPLLGKLSLIQNTERNDFIVNSIGTGIFVLPSVLNKPLTDAYLSFFNIQQNSKTSLVRLIIPIDEKFTISDIKIKDDLLELKIVLPNSIF